MKFRNLLAATAALSMAASPAIAQSAPSVDRAAAPVAGESEMGGDADGTGIILAILAVAAVVAGIVIAVGDDEDGDPISA
jgi:hypothetical protein